MKKNHTITLLLAIFSLSAINLELLGSSHLTNPITNEEAQDITSTGGLRYYFEDLMDSYAATLGHSVYLKLELIKHAQYRKTNYYQILLTEAQKAMLRQLQNNKQPTFQDLINFTQVAVHHMYPAFFESVRSGDTTLASGKSLLPINTSKGFITGNPGAINTTQAQSKSSTWDKFKGFFNTKK